MCWPLLIFSACVFGSSVPAGEAAYYHRPFSRAGSVSKCKRGASMAPVYLAVMGWELPSGTVQAPAGRGSAPSYYMYSHVSIEHRAFLFNSPVSPHKFRHEEGAPQLNTPNSHLPCTMQAGSILNIEHPPPRGPTRTGKTVRQGQAPKQCSDTHNS